jgi:DNA polymerase-4
MCSMAGPGEPTILHADLDAFYASVEQRDNPRLRGRPVLVGPGVVLSASYEARAFGVRTPMGVDRALRLCPGAAVVEARFGAYAEASTAVFGVFERTTPLVEGLSIDEAFLDVRGMERIAGTPTEIAARLRRDVREQVGLALTVGVATTKFLAKVASGVAKPDGLLVVPPGGELAFLHPLPVERLWGVGPVTARKLLAHGIRTVRQVAELSEPALVAILGGALGRHVLALAHNRDLRPVRVGRRRRSIGSQRALGLGRFPRSADGIAPTLLGLVERVTSRMRAARRVGRTVVLRMRFEDYTRATRSHTLAAPTSETQVILEVARRLLAAAMPTIERRGLTMVGVSVGDLQSPDAIQLALPFERGRNEALDAVVDAVRERFGSGALTRAALLGRDQGWSPPLLPD